MRSWGDCKSIFRWWASIVYVRSGGAGGARVSRSGTKVRELLELRQDYGRLRAGRALIGIAEDSRSQFSGLVEVYKRRD